MFDRTYVDSSTHYPDTINHHEHKAPTDQSVKLLTEMQEKAIDNLVCNIRTADNKLDIAWTVIDNRMCNLIVHGTYSLNGWTRKFNFTIPINELWNLSSDTDDKITLRMRYVVDKCKEAAAKDIADWMVGNLRAHVAAGNLKPLEQSVFRY